MAGVIEFRKAVDAALRRARPSRTRKDLARVLGVSQSELSKRLNAYHHRGKDGKERTWSLTPVEVFQIVEALVRWKGITSLASAQDLFILMDYPLQETDWQADPWNKLHTAPSFSPTPSHLLQGNEVLFGQATQARALERTLYLQHVIEINEWLLLPEGHEVPLERIYVSLRADEMSVKERQAEHALYLQEVDALVQEARARLPDPYRSFAAIRKVIAQYPKMFMLDARNWPRLFGQRDQQSLTLAEVIKHHQQVVILGDPGSGKTTLGKWLVLQYARALSRNDTQVRVPADLVHPKAEIGEERKELDLGPVKLPVFVSIAQYTHVRKPKEQPDRGLTLYEYLLSGRFLDPLRLPSGLSQEAAGAIVGEAVRQGQALIMLDGLDEVSDLTWRRKIMEAVRRFLKEWCHLEPEREERFTVSEQAYAAPSSANQVLITSRPVGYQFDPLVDLPHYTVEEMDEDTITDFCYAWMQHVAHPPVPSEEASQWANQLHDAIFSETHPGVRSMVGNPLLLTMMVQLAWKMRMPNGLLVLPTLRVDLFEEITRSFYEQREVLWEQAGIKLQHLTRAFGAVAMALHAGETAGFATEGEVIKCLRTVLFDEVQVEAVLSAARDVSGFLIARGEGVYGFLHRAVQEYFVAYHLVNQAEQIFDNLTTRALNPTWREPIVLAVGLMSRPKHPEHKRLPELFTALLDIPDPVGEFLPRRELLCAAACAECKVIPERVGRRLATSLLSCLAQIIRLDTFSILRGRIRQAFVILQQSPTRARTETEAVLCAVVQAKEFTLRYAAIDVIIETKWDSSAIAETLIAAWRTHADPAGSLLTALQRLYERQPGSFHTAFLPFKQRMEEKPWIWERAKARADWEAILRILYLPQGADVDLHQVNRDSPLTDQIITALEQEVSNPRALDLLHQHLLELVRQPGTADVRDAALVLSALIDTNWIGTWRASVGDQEYLARPVIASLSFFGTLARTRARVCALDLSIDLARDLAIDPTNPTNDIYDDRDLDRTFYLDQTLNAALSYTFAYNLNLIPNFSYNLSVLDHIELEIRIARMRKEDEADLMRDLDTLQTSINVLKQKGGWLQSVAKVWTRLVRTFLKDRNDYPERKTSQKLMLTSETLETLIEYLTDPDDNRRVQARQALQTNCYASALGKVLIETMATQIQLIDATREKHTAQVHTYLEWTLGCITHDMPNWIQTWIDEASQSQEETPATQILANIHKTTPEAFETLVQALPTAAPYVRKKLLTAFKWQVRRDNVPQMYLPLFAKRLLGWLDQETDDVMRQMIIKILGAWREQETAHTIGMSLLKLLEIMQPEQEESPLALALAHLVHRHPALGKPVHAILLQKTRTCGAALACLWTTMTEDTSSADALLVLAQKELSDPARCFNALLEAGIDDAPWEAQYHALLVSAAQRLLEHIPDALAQEVLRSLLQRLRQALETQDWPTRRMTLALVAACAEIMPTTLRQVGEGKLEQLLVRGAVDAESFTSRRFALTALSYLRTVTAAVVPALLAGCQDIEVVQRAAIGAAERFQRVEGDLLPTLLPALTGESASTAYAVARLLGALGTSTARTAAGLSEQIITALVEALKDPKSQRNVIIASIKPDFVIVNEYKGALEEALYDALLRVAGWIG